MLTISWPEVWAYAIALLVLGACLAVLVLTRVDNVRSAFIVNRDHFLVNVAAFVAVLVVMFLVVGAYYAIFVK